MPFTIFGWITIALFIIIIYLLFRFVGDWDCGSSIFITIFASALALLVWFGPIVTLCGNSGSDHKVTKKLYALTNTTNTIRKGAFVAADENYIIYCYVTNDNRLITIKKPIEYVEIVLEENVVPHVTYNARIYKLNKFGRLFYKEWAHRNPDITNRVIHLNRQNVNNEIMYNIKNF